MPRSTSTTSYRFRSCPGTRSWAPSTTGRRSPSNQCSGTPHAASPCPSREPPQVTATTTDTSPAATSAAARSSPASRPGSAARPAVGGRPSSSPTRASSTASIRDTPDEQAVLIEPLAGGIHAALLAAKGSSVANADAPIIAVLGAGTMGLAAVAGLVALRPGGPRRRRRPLRAPAAHGPGARSHTALMSPSCRPTSSPAPSVASTAAA